MRRSSAFTAGPEGFYLRQCYLFMLCRLIWLPLCKFLDVMQMWCPCEGLKKLRQEAAKHQQLLSLVSLNHSSAIFGEK